MWWIRSAYVFGPTPVPDAIERVEALQADAGDSLQLQAGAATTLARLLAMRGDFERARELYVFGRDFYRSAGMTVSAVSVTLHGSWIEHHAGNEAGSEEFLRHGADELWALGNRAFFSTVAARLALSLYDQGRFDEAGDKSVVARDASPPDDLINFVFADAIDGCLLALAGRHDEAEVLLRGAVDAVETTDFFFARADVHRLHAEAMARAGDATGASRTGTFALSLLDEKGDATGAALLRERFDGLGIAYA